MSTWVARGSASVIGGVATAQFRQGTAVTLNASGQHNDLPGVAQAAANAVDVYIAIIPPDNFPRPTDVRLYTKAQPSSFSIYDVPFTEMIDTNDYVKIGKSNLGGIVLIEIGQLVQCHRGGAYAVASGSFVDSANIRVIGNRIAVGANGQWTYTATASVTVGKTVDFRDGTLYIELDAKSA